MPSNGVTAVLLISCRDQKGLVAATADFIFRDGGNIIHADQHTDREQGIFLQRIEWEMEGFRLSRQELPAAFEPIARRFGMAWSLHYSDQAPRVAIFVSKQAHCMYDLLAKQRMGEFNAEVPLIVSNHPDLEPVARSFGVEYACYPITAETKEARKARLQALLQEHGVDVIVLARYMRVLSDPFVRRWPNRIINIHHSFLPAFVGARPYHQAYQRGVKIIGATAHYVTTELDQGPIIEQDVVRMSNRDSVEDLIRKGRDLEKLVLARAVDLHLRNRIVVYGNKTVVFT